MHKRAREEGAAGRGGLGGGWAGGGRARAEGDVVSPRASSERQEARANCVEVAEEEVGGGYLSEVEEEEEEEPDEVERENLKRMYERAAKKYPDLEYQKIKKEEEEEENEANFLSRAVLMFIAPGFSEVRGGRLGRHIHIHKYIYI